MRWIFILLLALLVAMVVFFSSGCEVLKTKRTARTDSTSVVKTDSTSVKKMDAGNKTDSTWWREIINFLPKGKDTVINNTTVPVYNYYPAQIIREGGRVSKEEWQRYMDSVNRARADSTTKTVQEETKIKETKVLSFWQIVGIAAGVGFIFFVLGKLKISLKTN